jgi:hypothetical protein
MNSFFKKLGDFFWGLISHYYAIFLVLTISFVAFGFFILYKDFFLLMQSKPIISLSKIQVKEEALTDLIEEINNRKLNIEQIEEKDYFNPFENVEDVKEIEL